MTLDQPERTIPETSPLLNNGHGSTARGDATLARESKALIVPDKYVHRVLLIAFSASVAMAATAATTVFAYAVILCKDPARCEGAEKNAYSGAVAVAAGISNGCGILALNPLQRAVRKNVKLGLLLWLASRATSVAILALSVFHKSIGGAILARIFEGLANDNLLHYTLGVIYVSISDESRFPSLVGYSLALFMVGMSASPAIASLLPNFFSSFIMALCMFAISLVYLAIFVPVVPVTRQSTPASSPAESHRWTSRISGLLQTFAPLYREASTAQCGAALLLFNATQSYLFPSLMVYTSTKLSFTNSENGYLVSIAATVSALYLMTVHFIKPRLSALWSPGKNCEVPCSMASCYNGATTTDSHADAGVAGGQPPLVPELGVHPKLGGRDFIRAIVTMSIQLVSLPGLPLATKAWQVYAIICPVALGLAAPSFIKSYAVSLAYDKPGAIAVLAMMEIVGGLLSSVVLGTIQSVASGEGLVFFWASGIVGAAICALVSTRFVRSRIA